SPPRRSSGSRRSCQILREIRRGEVVDMGELGHPAARLAHPLGHLRDAGVDGFQLRLFRFGQIEPGAGEQEVERLVGDVGRHDRTPWLQSASTIALDATPRPAPLRLTITVAQRAYSRFPNAYFHDRFQQGLATSRSDARC